MDQEVGCTCCRNEEPYDCEYDSRWNDYNEKYVKDSNFSFCPYCGRKLKLGETGRKGGNFFVMIGIPGSGKSTYAKKLAEAENAVVLSSDEVREHHNNQISNAEVFQIIKHQLENFMREEQNVIFDATNLRRKKRASWLKMAENYCYQTIAVVMERELEECIAVMEKRPPHRQVPKEKIRQYASTMELPVDNEFNQIRKKENLYEKK